MDRSSLPSAVAAATLPAPYAPRRRPTRNPPPSSGASAGNCPAASAESTQRVTEDHYRIIPDQNDVVVNRLFAAGLDLQAALQLIGDRRVAGYIDDAIDNLDQAIRDHRDIAFHRGANDS
jgi:hypothetical protein